jgi:mannose-6-phosphate isomerase-like protein (cupin superfamily)
VPAIRSASGAGIVSRAVVICDSFVIADWRDPGTHPVRPIAGLHVHHADDEAWIVREGTALGYAQIFAEHDSELLA